MVGGGVSAKLWQWENAPAGRVVREVVCVVGKGKLQKVETNHAKGRQCLA